jgi:putative hydrolase of the HAD superfamily
MTDHGEHLVCFDLGRVLVRICGSWGETCRAAGLPPFPELRAAARAQMIEVELAFELGQVTPQRFYSSVADLSGMSPGAVERAFRSWLLGPYPGAVPLLDRLRSVGARTACLSNTNEVHWNMMLEQGGPNDIGLRLLDQRFASHLMGLRKPDPLIFARVASSTETRPANIIYFDDLAENIAAAERSGWCARLILDDGDPIAQIDQELARQGVFQLR